MVVAYNTGRLGNQISLLLRKLKYPRKKKAISDSVKFCLLRHLQIRTSQISDNSVSKKYNLIGFDISKFGLQARNVKIFDVLLYQFSDDFFSRER